MRIMEFFFLLYATTNIVGLAKEAITMLEVKHREDYSLIKRDLIDMFDVKKNQELSENFLQKFKQLHTETVTSFYIRYQSYVNKLISLGLNSNLIYRANLLYCYSKIQQITQMQHSKNFTNLRCWQKRWCQNNFTYSCSNCSIFF